MVCIRQVGNVRRCQDTIRKFAEIMSFIDFSKDPTGVSARKF